MNMPERANLTRRDWLKGVVSVGASAALAGCSHTRMRSQPAATACKKPDSVWAENQKPGTNEWLLGKTEIDPNTKYRSPWIEGYCSQTSVRAGERLGLFVSTNPISDYVIEIYRMGYYG